jgi:hypothetical protein
MCIAQAVAAGAGAGSNPEQRWLKALTWGAAIKITKVAGCNKGAKGCGKAASAQPQAGQAGQERWRPLAVKAPRAILSGPPQRGKKYEISSRRAATSSAANHQIKPFGSSHWEAHKKIPSVVAPGT